MSHAEPMTTENQKSEADKSKRQSALAPAGLLGDWSKSMPTSPGIYEIKCAENFFIPEKVRVYIRTKKGVERLWVTDETIGSNPLEHFHDGLIQLEWRKVA